MALAIVQHILNLIAFVAWLGTSCLFVIDLVRLNGLSSITLFAVSLSEWFCVLEVIQIGLGLIRGRLVIGVGLHSIRVFIITVIFPLVPASLASQLVMIAWTTTEICRYPMLLMRKPSPSLLASTLRKIRFVAPVLTFPLGAGSEAWAIFLALPQLTGALYFIAVALIPNNLLGGALVYRSILKKAYEEIHPTLKAKGNSD